MAVKLLTLDLDGTLTTDLAVIPAKTREAIDQAMQRGVKVALATGREYKTAAIIARQLKLNAPVICYQGGVIRDQRTNKTLLAVFVPLEVSRRLIKFARAQKLPLVMYMMDGNFTEFPSSQLQRLFERDRAPLTIVHNLLSVLDEAAQPLKFVFVQPKGQNDKIYHLVEPGFGEELTVIRSSNILVEAFWPGASKGQALRVLADYFNIPLAQTMAIGDHDNDISMVQLAGLGVAMGNGSPEVKKAADVIAPPVSEEGVVWAIQRYILEARDDANS